MTNAADVGVLVVGGGVLGLGHAIAALRAGHRVMLCERDSVARGASVRNFGMIWPIGQPRGPLQQQALRSRQLWSELGELAGFRCEATGSLHVAYADDEWQVLEQFADDAVLPGLELLSAGEAIRRQPRLCESGLRGGLFSPHEANVDPGAAVAALHRFAEREGLERRLGTAVVAIESGVATLASGTRVTAEHIVVCTGDDFRGLFPELFAASGLVRCKLQMLALGPQPDGFRLGPMCAAGLTLLHYPGFAACPGLAALRARLAVERAAEIARGIHVLVSQRDDGCLIVGDSHEYGDGFGPVLDAATERLILDYLRTFLAVPNAEVVERWSGSYALQRGGEPIFRAGPAPGVEVVTGVGGSGMTRSLAIGEETVGRWRTS
ncbi:MAG: TIGR03364 family FAD-dependent oxidoreductase [Planctomycetes bacterium]|nr:TIGR03364 family FAD-dependent oxidoreductase [Planctomycetota bacterium]